ncbi:MAG TPA: 3-phosphoshikimate 1-carboxyvinyltransferase [Longimicrobiales bacterium]|nr:3-phosphoshikimate 1-carboxyvinyltransferase [Longimicrobiales bacterium]
MEMRVPGDKSITHRALLLGALASGPGRIRGALDAADTRATAAALRALGVSVGPLHGDEVRTAAHGRTGWRVPPRELDCANSGTTARLLLGALAAQPFAATLTGDVSLRGRPMRRVTDPLARMGARIEELAEPDRLPLRIHGGALRAITHESPAASAQVKSALLLAGLAGGVDVRVREPRRSRDHTERLLRALGVRIEEAERDGSHEVTLIAGTGPADLDLAVPGDFSSAAFLLGAAALLNTGDLTIRGVGVNPTRTGLLDVLARMGVGVAVEAVREEGGEPRADLRPVPGELRATAVSAAEVPALIDELPLVAVLAARAGGVTTVRGAAELRVKETDRIAALVAGLRALGVAAEEHPDGFDVEGTARPLRGRVQARGDHRIAMAFAVLGAAPGSALTIDQPELEQVSFPDFSMLLRRLQDTP